MNPIVTDEQLESLSPADFRVLVRDLAERYVTAVARVVANGSVPTRNGMVPPDEPTKATSSRHTEKPARKKKQVTETMRLNGRLNGTLLHVDAASAKRVRLVREKKGLHAALALAQKIRQGR